MHVWCRSVFCFLVTLLQDVSGLVRVPVVSGCDLLVTYVDGTERQVPYVLVRNKLDVDIELLVQVVKGCECFDKLLHQEIQHYIALPASFTHILQFLFLFGLLHILHRPKTFEG